MQAKVHGSLSQSEQEAHNISRQLGFVHTITESFCANKKAIGLLFAHKVETRIADRCSDY